jgi:TIR domain
VHHVFISYSRNDRAWVEELVGLLRGRGVTVWIDQSDIPVSLPWFQEVSDAIDAARVFLVCDSPRWRASSNCRAEHEIAERAGKQVLTLGVGEAAGSAAAEVTFAVQRQDRATQQRVELLVLARDWDRAGRPRGALVSRRSARHLARSAAAAPIGPTERAFLRASRARSRRRAGIAFGVGTALVACVVGWAVLSAVRWYVTRTSAAQALAFARINALFEQQKHDPVRALAAATTLGDNESAGNADYVTAAFAERVPDDAFAVDGTPARFASTPIGPEVVVTDAAGRAWQRAAGARSVRVAAARAGVGTPRATRPATRADGLVARANTTSGTVRVWRHGRLWRRIVFGRVVTALSVSPNGRELAVVNGNAVVVADLALGIAKTELRGRGESFRDVAWSADGDRVWAIGRRQVVSWTVRDGTVLRDSPRRSFEAVLPGTTARTAWVVAHGGGLEELDVQTGKHLRSIKIPDRLKSAGASADGHFAAVSGEHALWLVSLTAGTVRRVAMKDCMLGRPAVPGDGTVAVPCINYKLHRLDLATGREIGTIDVGPSGTYAVRALPDSRTLLVSDTIGWLYAVVPGQPPRDIYNSFCGGSISRIATSPDGRVVLGVGAGTGVIGCTRRLLLRDGGTPGSRSAWQADAVMDDVSDHVAQTAAISREGRIFAFGYESGEIVLHPTENITPTRTITTIDGGIRDMLVTADDQLLVATDSGTLTRIPLCETCVSNRAMATEARRLLDRLLTLDIAERQTPAKTTTGSTTQP